MALKDDILNILEANPGQAISGQLIADQLQVSRATVWKAINSLREQGCVLSSSPNKGYMLKEDSDFLTVPGIKANLNQKSSHREITLLDSVDSTNNRAKAMALEGAAEGSIVIAREQKAGRGRQGRSFFSPKDKGIYMSIILRPQAQFQDIQTFTIATGVAICRVIEEVGEVQPQIKWVNDIFINGKKVCGILTEAMGDLETNQADTVILGIGVNLAIDPQEFPGELQTIATSLITKGISKNKLVAKIIEEVEAAIDQRNEPKIMEEYKNHSLVLNREIDFTYNRQRLQGIAKDINSHGNLIVATSEGDITLYGGEISLRSEKFIDR